jgi:SGNH domain (fused to AT3 domains)
VPSASGRVAAGFLCLAVAGTLVIVSARTALAGCGTYRVPVQTLSDPDRRSVDLDPVSQSVRSLRSVATPGSVTATTPRIGPTEKHVFRVGARIVRAAVQANGDIRAIVAPRDDVHLTMAVVFHRPACITARYQRDTQSSARSDFFDACGRIGVGSDTELRGLVRIVGVGFWNSDTTAQNAAPNGIELNPVLGFSGTCWPSDGFHLVVTGDSIPMRLREPIGAATGWATADGAVGGCPASGEEPVNRHGVGWTTPGDCRSEVIAQQHRALAIRPDIVVWWDRQSVSHFLDFDDQVILSGTAAFWRRRRAALDTTVRRLSATGATVVLVETEPVSPGIDTSRRWFTFLVKHYFDTTTRWNRMRQRYAEEHPRLAVFVSITADVCHAPITSPCDDTTADGTSARPDGLHYDGAGIPIAVDALLARLAPVVERLGG